MSAQQRSLTDSIHYRAEMQATLSDGDHTPLWLNANKYGLSSLKTANGYLRESIERPLSADDNRKWGIGYGADIAVAAGFTSTVILQQAYVEGRWLKGTLTVGAKEYPMELKNQELSTGSQTLGINARPVPQVRLALPEYWTIPGTNNWLALKGHIAYGKTTDDNWQKDFVGPNLRYTENTLYHSKAGYLKIGPKRITLELGAEMACQFGGKSYYYSGEDLQVYKNSSGFKALWQALIPGGSDATDGDYQNASGNHLGSWVARLNFDYPKWNLGLYADHFFEDASGMFLLGYNGYGSGEQWNSKESSRYFLYDMKDCLLGAELKLKNVDWLSNLVIEYMYTKYQSGPVYHDHTQTISDHLCGRDNYYNHNLYTGWQHWGMVMGNPLYMSPLYNHDGRIEIMNNRFVAWHIGLSGSPVRQLHYRVLATWQKGYGTYYHLFDNPRETVSLLAEVDYCLPKGWRIKAAFGTDSGKLYGNNYGAQFTIAKTGLLKLK
nr:capsule assembly Wzi family protein [Prevotella sp. P6B1]